MKKEELDILQNEIVFDRLSGSAGNITAVSIGDKHYFRGKVKTECPNTEHQQTRHQITARGVAAWQSLATDKQEQWNRLGEQVKPHSWPFNDGSRSSGYSLFMSCYLQLASAGRESIPESVSETISMEEYRNDGKLVNEFDYSNYFFNCMDGIDLSTLRRYAASAGNPSTEFERFLDERSYINKDYIHEVIGTRYLRNQQYQSAVKWLEKVSEDYQSKTNVKWYMRRDPFEYRAPREGIRDNYKLSFAREMAALEKQLHSANPDERGLAMVKYGTGLRSSFTNCWALTQYHRVNMDWWEDAPGTKAAISKAESMIKEGLRTIRNPEKAAEAYFSQALYTTAAKKFASTRFMEEKFTQCPKLEDYK